MKRSELNEIKKRLHGMKKTEELKPIIEIAVQSLPEEKAIEAIYLFPEWEVGKTYSIGTNGNWFIDDIDTGIPRAQGLKLKYEDVLYSVLQPHTTQEGWTPTQAPSLFAEVLIPDENTIYEWKQPDSTNPYRSGDKTSHNGHIWESTVDNNVWEPGVYGWTMIE